jgi:hypothetical protein
MQSEIKVKGPSIKITLTIGLFLTVLIIWLSIWFSGEFRIILLSIGGGITLLIMSYAGNRLSVWRLQRKLLRLEVDARELEVERLKLSRFVLNFDQNQRLIIPAEHRNMLTVIEPVAKYNEAMPQLPESVAPLSFMELLPKLQTCIIVGGQNSGKTSLLHNVAYNRLQSGIVLAMDPHSDKWPLGVTIVGTGRDYQSIGAVLDKLAVLLDIRYKKQEPGKLVTLVCDEWLSIIENCDNAASRLKLILTEGRKVNIHLFLGSHTDRARQLGLTGYADMRDGMSMVYLNWQPSTDTRTAEILLNGKRQPIITPAPLSFVGNGRVLRLTGTKQVDSQAERIKELHAQGASFNEIAMEIYGSKGGWQTGQIKKNLGV